MLAFIATLGSGLLSLVLWYVSRSKHRRIWLPLLAVLRVPRQVLPRLTWQRPPIIALLCFGSAWLALLVYTTSPSYVSVTETDKHRLYAYIDFSASVSAHIDIAAYRKFLQAQWQTWQADAAVIRIETSHSNKVHIFNSADEFALYLRQLDFHRHATHIAAALQHRGAQLQDYDRVIVVSDYDAYSWRNIHWQPTLEHLPIPKLRNAATNFYLHQVDRQTQGIEIAVARAGTEQAAKLTLQIRAANKIIATLTGEMAANQAKTYLRVDFLPLAAANNYQAQLLDVEGDAIALDNTYLFTSRAQNPTALIVADLYGERAIDDPLYQLHTALAVLGLKVTRQDHARAVGHDLLILAYDRNFNAQEHCLMSSKKVWLLPQTLGTETLEACRCFQRLIGHKGGCAGKSWQEVLQASGAQHEQLWWRKGRVTVFATPLYTYQAAQLPVIIKHLLTADGLLNQRLNTDQRVPVGESRLQERELPVQANTVIGKRQEHVWAQALVWFVLALGVIELLFSRRSLNFDR